MLRCALTTGLMLTYNAKYNKRKIYDMKPQDFIGKKAT